MSIHAPAMDAHKREIVRLKLNLASFNYGARTANTGLVVRILGYSLGGVGG
jgi:hypothetical protein